MRKEPIIAIILGSLFGLGVAFFVWQYTTNLNTRESNNQNATDRTNAKNSENNLVHTTTSDDEISLISPIQLAVFSESPINVSGIADNNSIIAIASSEDIVLLNSEPNGEFTSEIKIGSGFETVNVWSFADDVFSSTKVDVLYSNQLDQSDQEGQELIKRTALLGSVTDISENTIQIKTPDDLIEQISVSSDTTYANVISANTDIEFSEVAIGDFIIGLGVRANNILDAERVLVTEEPGVSDLMAVFGEIVSLSSSEFIVTHADGKDYSIDATGKIDVTKHDENGEFVRARLSESSEGEKIIIIGNMEDELIASRIHIFPSPETDED